MARTEFLSRVQDAYNLSFNSGAPKFLGFLTAEEVGIAEGFLKNKVDYILFGGYEEADRVYLCVLGGSSSVSFEAFPITAVTFRFRECDKLTHRDFLGSLMSKGIKREKVGDILVEKGRAVVFLNKDIAPFVLSQTNRIGRVGVSAEQGFSLPLPQISTKESRSVTVASMRADAVVAALINSLRSRAEELIKDGFVAINSAVCQKTTRQITDGDKIAVRGYGKFTVIEQSGTTKKGRTVILTEKYK